MEKDHKIQVFPSKEALVTGAAETIVRIANESVHKRGRFVISLSGGHTPQHLYEALAREPYSAMIPWDRTFVFWGDERCVPADDERNNAHMARMALLRWVGIPAVNIFAVPVSMSPADAAADYESTIKSFFGAEEARFDLVLLGLGTNGHTASLFPGTPVLQEKQHLVKEVYVAEEDMYRVTMTAPLINDARCVIFLVEGSGKAEIIHNLLSGDAQQESFPAQLIAPAGGELYWYLDEAAAKLS